MAQSTLPSNITQIVMLMLENRSLDNLFGYLYPHGSQPQNVYPPDSSAKFNGIPIGASNPAYDWNGDLQNYPVGPIPIDDLLAKGDDPSKIPWYDPTEEYLSRFGTGRGVLNQMFGNKDMVSVLPKKGTRPGMLGFMQDYWTAESNGYDGMDILWMFQKEQIGWLSWTALVGAISDAWFSSVPTQTNPNRAFSLVGTSLGREKNQSISAVETFPVPTIFNGLANAGKTCGLYFTDVWIKSTGQSFTDYTFPQAKSALTEIGSIDTFLAKAAAGTLPAFSYLEPKWGWGYSGSIEPHQGTDLHPPMSVTPGDQFVGQVVWALAKGKKWMNTLLIITFDEHGGTYDHVSPPWTAINPDGRVGESGFNFDLFGVRVPTILFSPWVRGGTVFRASKDSPYPFDHTSLIKTLMLWSGGDVNGFFKRAAAAPPIEGIFFNADNEIADNSDAITKAMATAPPEPSAPQIKNDPLFEGMGFAAVRTILSTSKSPGEIVQKVDAYRRDPEGFEATLTP